MKVYIDVSEFMKIKVITGIQRVVREILVRILKNDDINTVLIEYSEKTKKFIVIDNERFMKYFEDEIGEQDNLSSHISLDINDLESGSVFFDLDVAWTSNLKRSYLLPILKRNGVKIAAQIYDIMEITHFQYFETYFTYTFMEYIGAHLLYSDLIIVSTRASLRILEEFAHKCGIKHINGVVAHLGADFKPQTSATSEVRPEVKKIGAMGKYLLMVGTIEPRKNHQLVLDAFDKGLDDLGINIIFAGRIGWIKQEFLDRMYNHKQYGKRIFHIDKASNADIDYLYKNAFVVAFPTHMEGFGLPLVEALERQTPVVATNIDVLKEIGKNYCEYFEDDNVDDFIKCVRKLMKQSNYEGKKRLLKNYQVFTWDESAKIMMDAILDLN